MEPADVVLRFLESVGRKSEAEFYLQLFRAEPKEQFAAISVDANVARHASDAVVLHLRFLAALGLFPTVLFGTFDPIDAHEHATRIRRKLEREGTPATLVAASAPDLAQQVTQAARAGTLPLIAYGIPDGATAEERFAKVAQLLTSLATRKLIFLHRPGGLRQGGALLPLVNLSSDYTALALSKELSPKERALLTQSRRLVFDLVPQPLNVAVTSPLNLFRELFTTKGAGTMLRRGATIQRRFGFPDLDPQRLRALIASAFGRGPIDEFFERPVSRVYLEENYRGVAVMVDTPLGGYLTKFAVEREAQGEGLGRDIWDAMAADYPTVFWRARPANPITEWYTKRCDGLARTADWTVYWKGLPNTRIAEAIEWTLARPVDMPPVPG